MTGSHTGSTLRLLSRSVFESLLGMMVPGQLAIGGGVSCPVEVGLKVARARGDESQLLLIQRAQARC